MERYYTYFVMWKWVFTLISYLLKKICLISHTCILFHTHTHSYTLSLPQIHSHIHVLSLSLKHTHSYTLSQRCALSLSLSLSLTYSYIHSLLHKYTLIHIYSVTQIHTKRPKYYNSFFIIKRYFVSTEEITFGHEMGFLFDQIKLTLPLSRA